MNVQIREIKGTILNQTIINAEIFCDTCKRWYNELEFHVAVIGSETIYTCTRCNKEMIE